MDYESALAAVMELVPGPEPEEIALDSAAWRVLSHDVRAEHAQPRFDNSAVDGFAICEADLGRVGCELRVTGVSAAGPAQEKSLTPGTSVRVTTGARLPANAAAVVMQECVQSGGDQVSLLEPARAGEHVRRMGTELQVGDVIVRAGTPLTPPVLSSLAADGQRRVSVARRARVALFSTGDELASTVEEGTVFESNSIGLDAMLKALLCEVEHRSVPDDLSTTVRAFSDSLEHSDLIVSTGGVSVGPYDFVRPALAELGFATIVPRVAIKPGKPFVFAMRQRDNKYAFGLPGNPMSAFCTFHLFVRPFIEKWLGLEPQREIVATGSTSFGSSGDREEFVPCRLMLGESGLVAEPLGRTGSHAVAALNEATGYARLAPHSMVGVGDKVRVHPFSWGRFPWR